MFKFMGIMYAMGVIITLYKIMMAFTTKRMELEYARMANSKTFSGALLNR